MPNARPDNFATITGNLADDPELRFTPAGVAVANMRVAVNGRWYDKDKDEWQDRLDGFFSCTVWREQAENIAESLRKGDRVTVIGRLENRSYEDRDGNTRWVTEIQADEVNPSTRWATVAVSKRGGSSRPPHPADASPAGASEDAPPPPTDDDVPFAWRRPPNGDALLAGACPARANRARMARSRRRW